jgi:hypothetical protein
MDCEYGAPPSTLDNVKANKKFVACLLDILAPCVQTEADPVHNCTAAGRQMTLSALHYSVPPSPLVTLSPILEGGDVTAAACTSFLL